MTRQKKREKMRRSLASSEARSEAFSVRFTQGGRATHSVRSVRLQKFLAEAGVLSRRKSEEIIAAGRVSVNGEIVRVLGTKVDPVRDVVRVDGEVVQREPRRVYLYHKPRGVTTTLYDQNAKLTVGHFIKGLPVRVFPVGRLDADVNGLLVLTNDGDFAERLLHPRFQTPRVYWARVRGDLSDTALHRLVRGVKLGDGRARAQRVTRLSPTRRFVRLLGSLAEGESAIELEVSEGRKHLVKRLLSAIGCPVVRLSRVQIGPYSIGNLAPGEIVEINGGKLTDDRASSIIRPRGRAVR